MSSTLKHNTKKIFTFAIAFIFLCAFLAIFIGDKEHFAESTNSFKKIEISSVTARDSYPEAPPNSNFIGAFDNNKLTGWNGFVNYNFSNYIIVNFERSTKLSKMFVNFGTSTPAEDFTIDFMRNGE
ncbi:MAG: hypothetical protein WCI57_03225 [Candidatus Berkelbacteria bacterium]